MRTRQVFLWALTTTCAHYATDCTIDRRGDFQLREEKIRELQMEVDLHREELRREQATIARLEAAIQEIAQRRKTLEGDV